MSSRASRMDHCPDQRAARKFIEQIRQDYTFDTNSRPGKLLYNALTILSNDLYGKDTHFLLELIQNADDNIYQCPTPTLNFTYQHGSLRIDCNEVGFTDSNVRAICGIGESTKGGHHRSTRFIGEKGVGFKSVFKVANVVHISSLAFSFKLDQSEPMGIINPIWAEFPEPTLPGYTSFYLQLKDDWNQKIAQELQQLDPTMLLFLRRIEELNITVAQQGGEVWSRQLRRTSACDFRRPLTVLHQDDLTTKYFILKHHVTGLPEHEIRPGCSESDILLAFPMSDDYTPVAENKQAVYAFLPIRDYGFKFLLQADFVLTANREDILNNPWNCSIRDATIDAFMAAVDHFNKGPGRYSWIYHIPTDDLSGFFAPLKKRLLERLSRSPVLESWAGIWTTPTSLTYVPGSMASKLDGKPFTLSSNTNSTYLSSMYPNNATALGLLSSLGVVALDGNSFLRELGWLNVNASLDLRQKPHTWHAQLAELLLGLVSNPAHLALVKALEIIPLRNGEWVSANGRPVFFNGSDARWDMLSAIDMKTVDPIVERDPNRHTLFTRLGVKSPPGAMEICHRILDLHASDSFDPFSLTQEQLLSHVLFMAEAAFQPPKGTDIWFATAHEDGRVKGSRAYMHGNALMQSLPPRLNRLSGKNSVDDLISRHLETRFPFIHSSYTTTKGRMTPIWLQQTFGISTVPRLTSAVPDSDGRFHLSDEFRFLFQTFKTSHVLLLLRDHWRRYYSTVDEATLPVITKEISVLPVGAYRGRVSETCNLPLRDTYLPTLDDSVDPWSHLPMLAISDPRNPRWAMLENFGVTVNPSLGYYLAALGSMKDHEPPSETVAHLYQNISARFSTLPNKKLIRNSFGDERLIYVRSSESASTKRMIWINLKQCFETGVDLVSMYPASAWMFQDLLRSNVETIDRLVEAAATVVEGADLKSRLETLIKVSRAIQVQSTDSAKQAVKLLDEWIPLFPVLNGWSDKEYDIVAPLKPEYPPWFIADRPWLREAFMGRCPLLAFSSEDVGQIEGLLKHLDLDGRRLSLIVTSESTPLGKPRLNKLYTQTLRGKAPFISALFPESRRNREQEIWGLCNVKVHSAARIQQRHQFEYGGRPFKSQDEEGQVCVSVESDALQIFMTRDNISSFPPPLDLVHGLAKIYGIENPTSLRLLQFALSEHDLGRLRDAFQREGLYVSKMTCEDGIGMHASLARDEYLDLTLSDDDEEPQVQSDDYRVMSNFKHIPPQLRDDGAVDAQDRTVPLRSFKWAPTILYRNTTSDSTAYQQTVVRSEPAHVQHVGEIMVSQLLKHHLGALYKPERDWTSPIRVGSGFEPSSHNLSSHAPFTIADPWAGEACADFLALNGWPDANLWAWRASQPTYHFDIAVSAEDEASDFLWTSYQFERMRNFRLDKQIGSMKNWRLENVHVLIRVREVFNDARFEIIVDPWRLLISDQLVLRQNWTFTAGIIPGEGSYPKPPDGRPTMSDASQASHLTTLSGDYHLSYKPLGRDTIRLIMLYPGKSGSQLRATIFSSSLLLTANFQAISYTWGGEQRSDTLWTPEGSVVITSSLYSALCSLRHEDKAVTLWADAICIDQDNTKEKEEQIRLLPHVFQRATCVLAFLGADSAADTALETLMQIRVNEALETLGDEWPKELPLIPSHWTKKRIPPADDPIWSEIGALFDRSWFRRAWIIQEIVVAMSVRVVCGKWMADWNDILTAVQVIERNSVTPPTSSLALAQSKWRRFLTLAELREREARHDRRPLLELLENFRYAECTIDHDRFFCLLGLAIDGNNKDFVLDYSLTFDAIVRKYAWAFIRQGRVMELLHRAGTGPQARKRFPSWIPDWTATKKDSLRRLSSRGMPCAASGRTEPRVEYNPSTNEYELRVFGMVVDTVKAVSNAANATDNLSSYLKEVDAMVCAICPGEEDLRWEVPIAGVSHIGEGAAKPNQGTMQESYAALCKDLKNAKSGGSRRKKALRRKEAKMTENDTGCVESSNSLWTQSQSYRLALQDLAGWRFMATANLHVGLVPPDTKVGDVVCVLDGGVVPFLLRKSTNEWSSRKTYQLVGECFVHGLMNGEADSLGLTKEMIDLR